ncbi:MAG: lasso peptide biosynthesis B2 protein [Hyphomonadaceae bacterium]|nr:lasso peptide biosynthesis B2 protein [Hyphomonadaceae bacterium]
MYTLTPNVRACVDQSVVVFLDLRNDRYLSVDLHRAPAIVGVCQGAGPNAAASLVARGLIEVTPAYSRDGAGLIASTDPNYFRSCRVSLSDVVAMLDACVRASMTVRARRLDRAFRTFARRKRLAKSATIELAEIVGRFERLRPWYPRARVCLFDSLALMNFLLTFGQKPEIVMGVRATPFAAHCWVESGGVCLNDAAETCRSYTPIAWA